MGTFFGLTVSAEMLWDGKENSYERSPGGVPFVLNHKFSALETCGKLASAYRKEFSAAVRKGVRGKPKKGVLRH